jgi:hypothetical protein
VRWIWEIWEIVNLGAGIYTEWVSNDKKKLIGLVRIKRY